MLGDLASIAEIAENLLDTTGSFREGYDEQVDETAILDLRLDQLDFGENEDWNEDLLVVDNEGLEGAAFSGDVDKKEDGLLKPQRTLAPLHRNRLTSVSTNLNWSLTLRRISR